MALWWQTMLLLFLNDMGQTYMWDLVIELSAITSCFLIIVSLCSCFQPR